MGLDSIWMMPEECKDNPKELPYFDPELNLITGFLFDCPRSFRGKVYNTLVESVTGVDLYQEEIPNTVIKEMAVAFEEYPVMDNLGDLNDLLGFDGNASENLQHFNDLKRMFRAFADAGATLVGWW